MEKDKRDFKTESKIFYDDRRKELKHATKTEENALGTDGKVIGKVTTNMIGIYKVEGINNIYKNLHQDKIKAEQGLKMNKEQLKGLKEIEEDKEVKHIKEIIKKISKLKQKEQLEIQGKELREKLKFCLKSIREKKEAIGGRLKL